MPAAQSVQPDAPAAEYFPASQAMHADACLAPVVGKVLPEAHAMQLAEPVSLWCAPAGHFEQALAPTAEYSPEAQVWQVSEVRPTTLLAEYCPAGQEVQVLAPVAPT